GPAPEAARMLLVAPEVIEIRPVLVDGGDAVARVHDFQQALADGIVRRDRFEDFFAVRVLRVDPGHGALAVDVFEPEVIVCRRVNRIDGAGIQGQCRADNDAASKASHGTLEIRSRRRWAGGYGITLLSG